MAPPIRACDEANRIIYELFQGKIGKDGNPTVQSGTKGPNDFFYALKRLLATEDIRTEHGARCSLRRKMITVAARETSEAGENIDSPEVYYRIREAANKTFLAGMERDADREAYQFWANTIVAGSIWPFSLFKNPTPMVQKRCQEILEQAQKELQEIKPWFLLEALDGAADHTMALGHKLKLLPFSEVFQIEKLIETLRENGPLMIMGHFGKHYYTNDPVEEDYMIEGHKVYKWAEDSPTSEARGIDIAIIIGAEKPEEGDAHVYWIDPKDKSDPASEIKQPLYVSNFKILRRALSTLHGLPIEKIIRIVPMPKLRTLPVAYYNPNMFV